MIATLTDCDGWHELRVDGRLVCSFDDRARAERVLARYESRRCGADTLPFVRVMPGQGRRA